MRLGLIARIGAALVLIGAIAVSGEVPRASALTGLDGWVDFYTMSEDPTIRGYASRVTVQVEDQDLPAGLTHIGVRVTSTSDRQGIVVRAERVRTGPLYLGHFRLSGDSTDDSNDALKVLPGDSLQARYVDAGTSTGVPAVRTADAPFSTQSRAPHPTDLVFRTAGGQGFVEGARRAVGAGADVTVWSAESGGIELGRGTAESDGSFDVPHSATSGTVWVLSKEPNAPESERVAVRWATLVGRVVSGDAQRAPISSALVSVLTSERNEGITYISNASGRFAATQTPAGAYLVSAEPQGGYGDESSLAGSEWDNDQSYGNAPPREVVVTGTETVDMGELQLLAPTFFARVIDDAGFTIPGAVASTTTSRGEFVPAGAYSRAEDGRFALYLPDGEFDVLIDPPRGCAGFVSRTVRVRVTDGAATPNQIDINIGPGAATERAFSFAVGSDGDSLELGLFTPDGPLDVVLREPSGTGMVAVGCRSVPAAPDLDVVNPGAHLDVGIDFDTADVCLGYSEDRLAGIDESGLELVRVDDAGVVSTLTTMRDATLNRVCGSTSGFSSVAIGVPGAVNDRVTRLWGGDRIETGIAISRDSFPSAGSAGAVVLAQSEFFADALAGAPLAGAKAAPLLLTGSAALDARVASEIVRVLPGGGTVYLLGGAAALSTDVEGEVRRLGFIPVRFAGGTRYETAVVIAEQGLGAPQLIFEATGHDFPDALAGSAAAVAFDGAVLLTDGAQQSAATTAYIARHPNSQRYALGGPAAQADPLANPVVGSDRYDTAVRLAAGFGEISGVGVASGAGFADALGGGVHAGRAARPLVLVPPTGDLPASVAEFLSARRQHVVTGTLYGGTRAVDDSVLGQVRSAIT